MKTLKIKTASGTYLVVDLPEEAKTLSTVDVKLLVQQHRRHTNDVLIPIGFGKNHPELMDDLPIKDEMSHACTYGCAANDNSCSLWQSNKCDSEIESEQKYVFKNPYLLEKVSND